MRGFAILDAANSMNDEERVTYFGETDARNKRLRFGIKKKDRSRHMYVIGKTGMGKSTLLENLAVQDIMNGEGLAFIDPHGKSADLLLEYIPEHRIKDVVYFAPFDLDYPISFNVLEDVGADRRHLVANGLMSAFKKIWVDAWSARMEYILTNILLALLEYPGSTLLGVNRMLVDKEFRNTIVNNISDPSVKAFWTEEYAKYTDKFAAEAAPAIQNKVGQFVANPLVRNIIGQSNSSFDIRKIMDDKKIFIVNLSKGRVGEGNANLLGAMIITKIYLAAMSRADLSESELKKSSQFYLYVDEFQSFANESFADILSEARKYKLNLTIAHQYVEQMTEEVRAAVFGNVGTMAIFRVGAYDADIFQKEFAPQFTAEDIVNLQQYQMYLKLMIDGVTSTPFSAKGMPPIPRPERMYVQEIIDASREQFAKGRIEIEDEIRRWHIEKIKPVGQGPSEQDSFGHGSLGQSPVGQSPVGQNSTRPHNTSNHNRPASTHQNASRRDNQGYEPRSAKASEMNYERRQRPEGAFGNQESRDKYVHQDNFRKKESDQSIRYEQRAQSGDRDNSRDQPQKRQTSESQFRHNPAPIEYGAPQTAAPQTSNLHMAASQTGMPHTSAPRDSKNFAFRNAIRDAERERREFGTQPKQVDIDREKDLRDAISLNYLKDKKEEEREAKNREKDARPQNVMALKEALLGLLGDVNQKEPMSQGQSFQKQSTPQERHEEREGGEKQDDQVKHHIEKQKDIDQQSRSQNHTQSTQHMESYRVQSFTDHGAPKESIYAREKEVDVKTIEQIFE